MGLATKRMAYHSPVHFWDGERWVYTTAGRVVFHSILPEGIRREGFLNQVMRKRDLSGLGFNSYRRAGGAGPGQILAYPQGVRLPPRPHGWAAVGGGGP